MNAVAALGGCVVGGALNFVVYRWILRINEVRSYVAIIHQHAPSPAKCVSIVVRQALLHIAPWLILALGMFAYYVRSELWAPWFLGGVAAGFLAIVTCRRIHRGRGKANAA